ncbi:hypothetical protein QP185_22495 [Sphingomonas aerolata]|uniref:hypothetical protein n=1 Tax=Sphingomonas aerolata TaxID=185951 RepID=UPI002FDFCF14
MAGTTGAGGDVAGAGVLAPSSSPATCAAPGQTARQCLTLKPLRTLLIQIDDLRIAIGDHLVDRHLGLHQLGRGTPERNHIGARLVIPPLAREQPRRRLYVETTGLIAAHIDPLTPTGARQVIVCHPFPPAP